jgi:hypothetical protein
MLASIRHVSYYIRHVSYYCILRPDDNSVHNLVEFTSRTR